MLVNNYEQIVQIDIAFSVIKEWIEVVVQLCIF